MSNSLLVRLGRFGVQLPRPLWRSIISREARRAGAGIAWLTPDHHRIRDYAVTEIIRTGEPLPPNQIAAGTGVAADRVGPLLDELERGKVFLFRTNGVDVDWAYPVTAEQTPHRVTFDSGETRYAA